jgi:hypothetical protein
VTLDPTVEFPFEVFGINEDAYTLSEVDGMNGLLTFVNELYC